MQKQKKISLSTNFYVITILLIIDLVSLLMAIALLLHFPTETLIENC